VNLRSEAAGAQLRRVRKAKGLSMPEVQRRSGGRWKQSTLSNYELADRTISLPDFIELCEFYGADPVAVLALSLAYADALEHERAGTNLPQPFRSVSP
jgi:transcriptional regulator with XRE-family HTH domain